MLRNLFVIGIGILSFTWCEAQYISKVLEYTPAPGQFTNTLSWGSPHAASSILGRLDGSLCLGAWGGYVVFQFEDPVENHPDNPYGVDFTIFGNPMAHWSEPGVVRVMKDENSNGLPDDTWYELAGSDHYFSTTIRNYQLTYVNPGDTLAREVPWSDSHGGSGFIKTNSAHTQPYYPLQDSFPHISPEQYTLTGTWIPGAVDVDHPSVLNSASRAFGYADNHLRGQMDLNLPDNPYTHAIENSGGDAFDIDWAVDSSGSYVDLDRIHFVQVQNALQADGKWLGELSTEICGARDVNPDPGVGGELNLIVIRDLPAEISSGEYQMEVYVFYRGRIVQNPDVIWTTSSEEVIVDEGHVLRASASGPVNLSASLASMAHIKTSVSTTIQLEFSTGRKVIRKDSEIQLYPNPARDLVQLNGVELATLSLLTPDGKPMMKVEEYKGGSIDISTLPPGMYIIGIDQGSSKHCLKLIKE
ncbi:MAG: T9SS type A sorting domain-containing protein [Bacteroidota bacterium]